MSRTPRELESREAEERKSDTFRPASLLPTPASRPGVRYRWVRASTLGNADVKNVSSRIREGWVPVKLADHPELEVDFTEASSRFPEGVEIGGLILCETSVDNAEARNAYYGRSAKNQMDSVDRAYLRENDPRMPMLRPERKTRTTFGSGE